MSGSTRFERASHAIRTDHAELRLADGEVVITKQVMTEDVPRLVRIPAARIRGAELQKPARGQPGWLHVAAVDGSPRPPTALAAANDPYTVPVTARNLGAARRFCRLVAEHVRDRGLPAAAPEPGTGSTSVLVRPAGPAPSVPSPAPTVPPPGAVARP